VGWQRKALSQLAVSGKVRRGHNKHDRQSRLAIRVHPVAENEHVDKHAPHSGKVECLNSN
jgi:hypothetical protein